MNTITINLENVSEEERKALIELVERIETKKTRAWPQMGDYCYGFNEDGRPNEWKYSNLAHTNLGLLISTYHAFPTASERDKELAKLKAKAKIAAYIRKHDIELVDDPDERHFMLFSSYGGRILIWEATVQRFLESTFRFKDAEGVKQVINNCEPEIRDLLA